MVDPPPTRAAPDLERDAAVNRAAREERLRIDGTRELGANLEQADALIKVAFELAAALPAAD